MIEPLSVETLAACELEVVELDPARLWRISRHDTGEPYFGRSGLNRFDDPRQEIPAKLRYGTCYFGLSMVCAFAETVLHDRVAKWGRFQLPVDELVRQVLRFGGRPLRLADMTGVHLKRLGGDGSLSTMMPYQVPQSWSLAIHQHPARVDGFLYMSRHLNNERAVIVFDRARGSFDARFSAIPLLEHEGLPEILRQFRVMLI